MEAIRHDIVHFTRSRCGGRMDSVRSASLQLEVKQMLTASTPSTVASVTSLPQCRLCRRGLRTREGDDLAVPYQ